MCGIAGIITTNIQDNVNCLIERMQSSLRHRGPDDQGIFISQDKQASLAHTRLSILDLSDAGHQPMSVDSGRYWITFNGEIYNFQELRCQLETLGEKFDSQTDTEVILKSYKHYGKDCVNYFRGMFALAIWDDLEKTCFICRDHLGIKPLYYWYSESTIIFASELRALLASRIPSLNLCPEGLYSYLKNGTVSEPHTLIDKVYCLEAGHFLYWKEGKLDKKQYWQVNFKPDNITLIEAQQIVRESLLDTIKHHFISDVPVGIFLSGGIDSTSLVALAHQANLNNLDTYSIAFEESKWSEGQIAKKTAQYFNTNHTEYQINASIGKTLFNEYLDCIDQPSIDGFNTFCVSKIAREAGSKVVLSGLGGDEFFGGYQSFQKIPYLLQWGLNMQKIAPINYKLGKLIEDLSRLSRWKRLGDFLQQEPNIVNAYQSFRGIFSHQEACLIMEHFFSGITGARERNFQDVNITEQPSIADAISLLEITHYMRNQLLRDSDVMSMAWGLELRVPFVDQILFEKIASIPSDIRNLSGKKLLIQAIPELPDWVINRPKQGFSFPLQKWIEKDWNLNFEPFIFEKDLNLSLWYRRWSLINLKMWWERITA